MLTVCMHTVHEALLKVALALRKLDGKVVSVYTAKELNVIPGSHVLDRNSIKAIHNDLSTGLALLEGCIPTSHLNPITHHLCHYAQQSFSHGCLRWYWLFGFERFNKRMKNLVHNNNLATASLANSVVVDAAVRYVEYAAGNTGSQEAPRPPCMLVGRNKPYFPTQQEINDLALLASTC